MAARSVSARDGVELRRGGVLRVRAVGCCDYVVMAVVLSNEASSEGEGTARGSGLRRREANFGR